ncbi:RNA binding protein, heterogenous nuclear RNP-K like protein [Chytridiales sp. JEL 0842]|nr:RNA binding protein, heterogenous nuclear RNP-K like protein [Chytridiales sp. JEL 0842]
MDSAIARLTGLTLNPETPPHQQQQHFPPSTPDPQTSEYDDSEEPSSSSPKKTAAASKPSEEGADGGIAMRALLHTREAGVIIGKGGKNVAEVREETGVKAGVSKVVPGVQERILTIQGGTLAVAKAFSMMANYLLENPVNPQPPANADYTTIKLLVAHQLMGSIIGKAGSKIKEIQEESGAKLVISKEMLPQSTERVIEVYGSVESIKIAIYNIAECILNDYERAAGTIQYNPQVRLSSHGYNNGPVPRTGRFDDYNSRPSSGPRRRGSNDGGYPTSSYNSNPTRRYNNSSNSSAPTSAAPQSTENLETQTITVPSDMVGCIIGKGGSFISTIRRQSGARLRIAEEEEGTFQRVVTITGSHQSNKKALQMIYDQLESEKERRMQAAEGDE